MVESDAITVTFEVPKKRYSGYLWSRGVRHWSFLVLTPVIGALALGLSALTFVTGFSVGITIGAVVTWLLVVAQPIFVALWVRRILSSAQGPYTWTFRESGIVVSLPTGQKMDSPWSLVNDIFVKERYCYLKDQKGWHDMIPMPPLSTTDYLQIVDWWERARKRT